MKIKHFIFGLLLYYIYCLNVIEIPFKSKKSNEYIENRFFSEFYDINLFANIEIGSNNQIIDIPIKINKYLTYLTGNQNINLSSPKFYDNSTTYNKLDNIIFNSSDDDFISAYKSSDNFNIGNKYISNLIFYLSNNQIIDESGTLGLKVLPIRKEIYYLNNTGFINQLKERNIISSYDFYFKFDKSEKLGEYTGKLFIGGMPHEIESSLKYFNENNFVNANIQKNVYNTTWDIYFMKINYGNVLVEEQKSAIFSTSFGLIHAPIFFESSMKKYFFEKDNCFLENNGYFRYFYCNEKVDISQFQNLYFESLYQQINFTLTYKDLFYKINNKNYFLILFNNDTYIWKFGLHFLSKFTLVFNTDKQTIGYYYNTKENTIKNKKSKSYLLYILLSIFFIFIIILISIIIYLLLTKKRKLRPYELEDDYDYDNKINN